MKRKFEGQELIFATKGLENRKQERDWILYQLDYNKLMLDKGLEMNHKKNVRDFIQQKHEFEKDLVLVNNTINVLQTQIREGVEVKENKKEVD